MTKTNNAWTNVPVTIVSLSLFCGVSLYATLNFIVEDIFHWVYTSGSLSIAALTNAKESFLGSTI